MVGDAFTPITGTIGSMLGVGGPGAISMPKTPDAPPPPPPPAEQPDPNNILLRRKKRQEAAAAQKTGRLSTILSDASKRSETLGG